MANAHLSCYSLDISLSAPAASNSDRLNVYNRKKKCFFSNLIITLKIALAGLCSSVDVVISGVSRNFVRGGGGETKSVEDREKGDLGTVAPLVRGSGGSCNLVQEISFHIVTFS